MELSEVADELYAATPDDFMKLRTAQIAAAKADGDKELAKQIAQLRKPTRSAWLVNLLARRAPDAVTELLEIGNALRDAQQNLDGAELRRLSTARHRAVDALSRQAADLGAEADYTATEAVRQEVRQTLQAALADPEQAELVRRGTLSQAVSYGGFGPFDVIAPAPTSKAAKTRHGEDGETDTAQPDEEAEQAAREAQEAWELARDQLAEAEEEAERTTAEADALADQVDELRQQLQAAEKAEDEARRTARTARKRLDEAAAAERSARQAVPRRRPVTSGARRRVAAEVTGAGGTGDSHGPVAGIGPRRVRTVGVEEELLLIDAASGEPTAVAGAVLLATGRAGSARVPGAIEAELQQQQVEVETAPTERAGRPGRQRPGWRRAADERARSLGARVAALATSPLPVTARAHPVPALPRDERTTSVSRPRNNSPAAATSTSEWPTTTRAWRCWTGSGSGFRCSSPLGQLAVLAGARHRLREFPLPGLDAVPDGRPDRDLRLGCGVRERADASGRLGRAARSGDDLLRRPAVAQVPDGRDPGRRRLPARRGLRRPRRPGPGAGRDGGPGGAARRRATRRRCRPT